MTSYAKGLILPGLQWSGKSSFCCSLVIIKHEEKFKGNQTKTRTMVKEKSCFVARVAVCPGKGLFVMGIRLLSTKDTSSFGLVARFLASTGPFPRWLRCSFVIRHVFVFVDPIRAH